MKIKKVKKVNKKVFLHYRGKKTFFSISKKKNQRNVTKKST